MRIENVFEHIVVALDGSSDARAAGELALRFARRLSCRITGICVIDVRVVEGPAVETLAPLWGEVTGRPFQPEVMRLYRERAESTLGEFCEAAESTDTAVERAIEIGVAEEAILEAAARADLLVLGRRGEHAGFGRQSIGATLWRVLHRSTCPVLAAAPPRAAGEGPPSTACELPLVAWDDSSGARKALDLAMRYAKLTGCGLRIVHAGDESQDRLLDSAYSALADSGLSWESARLHVRPAEAVAEALARWEADCVFMGAFGRGRLRDLLFGSHTAEIFERVDVPVFVTP